MISIQKFLKSASLLFFLLLMADAAAQSSFSSAIDDLPLMDGLNEAEGGTMVFDSSSGRIVEALSSGKVTRRQVIEFYRETLPQLGWHEIRSGHFVREDEVLKIEFPSPRKESLLTVLFMLSPAQ